MVYSAPELLLVGAAQNLVLLNDSQGGGCEDRPTLDAAFLESDVIALW